MRLYLRELVIQIRVKIRKTHSTTFFIYFRKNHNSGEFSKSVDFRTFLSNPKVRLYSKIYKMLTGLTFPTIPACRLQYCK